MISWRTAAIVLAVVCCVQRWQSCTRSSTGGDSSASSTRIDERVDATRQSLPQALAHAIVAPSDNDKPAKKTLFGLRLPAWAQHLLPQPGEKLGDYRDRIVPLAEVAVAPQRARVARMRDQLGDPQRAALDAAVGEAATAIEARVASAFVDGELQSLKPMSGVTVARDVLDIVDRSNTQFVTALTADQRAQLASSRFDFADYLLFSTRWEDALMAR
ncbi:MAG TPA: hypothetical protein VFQ65_04860 [Kofleriaceae bacterium]|nr:hypothetical protein [Kofleriaceae bacterium]